MPKKAELPESKVLFAAKQEKAPKRLGDKETERHIDKVKVSVYLTPATRNALETARFKLRTEHNIPATNSDLAEVALSRIADNVPQIAGAVANLVRKRRG